MGRSGPSMDTSPTVNVPARSSGSPIQPLSSSLMEKFLGTILSPASVPSPSSDASFNNDLDDMNEQDIWGIEINNGDTVKGLQQASLPPRMASASRRVPDAIDGRSSFKDGSTSWVSSTVNSLSSISGTLPGSSPLGSGGRNQGARVLSSEATARRLPAAFRMIPRMSQQHSEVSSASIMRVPPLPQSAPLNIPHWSQLERKNRATHAGVAEDEDEDADEDEDEDVIEQRIPPHEILERQYARSQRTSFSVLEGAGRTLKGRDLSRVRNAVLTYTGFVE